MPCLRLTQSTHGDSHTVHVSFEGTGVARQTANVAFSFALSAEDEGDLRWYLEDYLEWPQEPAPTIAARVEKRMEEIGAARWLRSLWMPAWPVLWPCATTSMW